MNDSMTTITFGYDDLVIVLAALHLAVCNGEQNATADRAKKIATVIERELVVAITQRKLIGDVKPW